MYFVIHNSEGDAYVESISEAELIERLNPDENGDFYYGKGSYLNEISETDTNYWGCNILIIKGEIVTPKVTEVIKKITIK